MANYVQLNSGLRQVANATSGVMDFVSNNERTAEISRRTDLAERQYNDEASRIKDAELGRMLMHSQTQATKQEVDLKTYFSQNPDELAGILNQPGISGGDAKTYRGGRPFSGAEYNPDEDSVSFYMEGDNGRELATTEKGTPYTASLERVLKRVKQNGIAQEIINARDYLSQQPVGSPQRVQAETTLKQTIAAVGKDGGNATDIVLAAEKSDFGGELDAAATATTTTPPSPEQAGVPKQGLEPHGFLPRFRDKSLRGGKNTKPPGPGIYSDVDLLPEGFAEGYDKKLDGLRLGDAGNPSGSFVGEAAAASSQMVRDGYNNTGAPFVAGVLQTGEHLVKGGLKAGQAVADIASSFFSSAPTEADKKTVVEASKNSNLTKPNGANPSNVRNMEDATKQAEVITANHTGPIAPLARTAMTSIESVISGGGDDRRRRNPKEAWEATTGYLNYMTLRGLPPNPNIMANLSSGDDMAGSIGQAEVNRIKAYEAYAKTSQAAAKRNGETAAQHLKDLNARQKFLVDASNNAATGLVNPKSPEASSQIKHLAANIQSAAIELSPVFAKIGVDINQLPLHTGDYDRMTAVVGRYVQYRDNEAGEDANGLLTGNKPSKHISGFLNKTVLMKFLENDPVSASTLALSAVKQKHPNSGPNEWVPLAQALVKEWSTGNGR